MHFTRILVLVPLLAATPAGPAAAQEAPGAEIARTHCSRCHIVDEQNRFSGIASTPSFKTLITALDDWRDRFDSFYARNPHPAHIRVEGIARPDIADTGTVPVELTRKEVDALLAHVYGMAKAYGRE